MTIQEKIKYLEQNNLNYEIDDNNILVLNFNILDDELIPLLSNCIINGNISLRIDNIPDNLLNNCTIHGYVGLSHLINGTTGSISNCIIIGQYGYYGNLHLPRLKTMHSNFLQNIKIRDHLRLEELEYLPKGFCPNVGREILLNNLKSQILKELIEFPGINRQLGFNLLKI